LQDLKIAEELRDIEGRTAEGGRGGRGDLGRENYIYIVH